MTQLRGGNKITIQHCIEINIEEIIIGRESKCPRVSQVFQEGPGPFLTNILVRFRTQYLRTSKFDKSLGVNSYLSYHWHHCQQLHWHHYLEFQGLYLPKPKGHHTIGFKTFWLQQTEGMQGFMVWGSQFLGTYGYEKPMVQSTYGTGHLWSQSHVL